MHVEASGDGVPLVLLHGWGLNLRVFDTLVPAFERRHRVIRVDLAGHGRSAWSERAATLAGHAMLLRDAVHAHVDPEERYAIAGWSLGGQLALQLAAATPGRVERLVLIASTPRFTASKDWPHGMSDMVLDGFAQRLASDWRATVGDFLELQVRGSTRSGCVLRELQAALVRHGEAHPPALAAGLATLAETDLRGLLGSVGQPSLVVAGQYDRITPPGACRALAGGLRGGRYLEVQRAGHAPFLSHPREVAGAMQGFLA